MITAMTATATVATTQLSSALAAVPAALAADAATAVIAQVKAAVLSAGFAEKERQCHLLAAAVMAADAAAIKQFLIQSATGQRRRNLLLDF